MIIDFHSRLGLLLSYVFAVLVFIHLIAANVVGWLSVLVLLRFIVSTGQLDAHWRVIPLVATTIICSSLVSVDLARSSSAETDSFLTQSGKIAIEVVLFVICVITNIVLYLFPLKLPPKLSGPYQRIGATTFVIDNSCFTKSQQGNEEKLNVQCWFPIAKEAQQYSLTTIFASAITSNPFKRSMLWTSGHPSQQGQESDLLLTAMSKTYQLPAFLLKHLKLIHSNSEYCENCDLIIKNCEDNSLPIAIYSHGMYGWRQVHHTTCEMLASNGFIVFACDHFPDCMVTRPHQNLSNSKYFDYHVPEEFPADLYYDEDENGVVIDDNVTNNTKKEYSNKTDNSESDSNNQQQNAKIGEINLERRFYHKGINRRVNQLNVMLNYILSQDSLISQQFPNISRVIDKNQINLWGHSFGGGTIATLAAREKRINSIVLLDSWMYPVPDKDRKAGSDSANVLLISSEVWQWGKFQMPFREDYVINSKGNGKRQKQVFNTILRGSDHQAFCDVWMICHKSLLKAVLGAIDPFECCIAMDQIIVDFFLASKHHQQLDNQGGYVCDSTNRSHIRQPIPTTATMHSNVGTDYVNQNSNSDCEQLIQYLGYNNNNANLHLCGFIRNQLGNYDDLRQLADYTPFNKCNR